MPWNATTNPYRTIDRMPIDITAFNGITTAAEPGVTSGADRILCTPARPKQRFSDQQSVAARESGVRRPRPTQLHQRRTSVNLLSRIS